MLISLDAIEEFLSSLSNGDVFTITRLAGNQWDVVVTAYIRHPARPDHTVIDLTGSDEDADEEAEAVGNTEVDTVASASSSAESASSSTESGGNDTAAIHNEETSDDDSVDYALSQDFLHMAEVLGDE